MREIGESIEVGGAPATESYLNIDAVLAAARRVGADAIHPGYGFLSENAAFARAVEAAGLVFIGPDAATIERIGGKASAKREAARAGLPVIDGTDRGLVRCRRRSPQRIRDMPLPVLLKAVAGGGGRGMAVIERADDIEARIESAMREARAVVRQRRADRRALLAEACATSRCRSPATATARRSTCSSASAPCSAAIRS